MANTIYKMLIMACEGICAVNIPLLAFVYGYRGAVALYNRYAQWKEHRDCGTVPVEPMDIQV